MCFLCGQPIEHEAPFRIPEGDVTCHKQCLMQLQSGVWQLLEHEGEGEPRHFEDNSHSHDDLLPDDATSQIRPYLVANQDVITPAASLDTRFEAEPQQVHKSLYVNKS